MHVEVRVGQVGQRIRMAASVASRYALGADGVGAAHPGARGSRVTASRYALGAEGGGAARPGAYMCSPRNCARCLLGGVGMSKTSCAARCSRGSVQGVLRAPAEGEGGVAHHENFSAAATATLERSGGTVAHGKRAARGGGTEVLVVCHPTLALGRSSKHALHRASRAARSARRLRHPHSPQETTCAVTRRAHVGARARSAPAFGTERVARGSDPAATGARARSAHAIGAERVTRGDAGSHARSGCPTVPPAPTCTMGGSCLLPQL